MSKRIFTSRWFILSAALVVLYSLLGFFLLPFLAGHYMREYVENQLNRELILKELRFNPFTFTLRVKDFGIQEKDRSPLVSLTSFYANFDLLSSLYYRAWTFSSIRMTDPQMRVVVMKGGRSHFYDLLKELKRNDGKQNKSNKMSRVLIEQVTLRGGEIDFVDQRKSPPAAVHLRSLAVDLEELTTLPERTGGYVLSGRTKAGERLKWRGTVSLNPIQSEGSVKLEKVKAATVWEFLKGRVACDEPAGEIHLTSEYLFDLGKEESVFTLKNLDFEISSLTVTPRGEQVPVLSLDKAVGRKGTLQWKKHSLSLETFRMEGGEVRAQLDETGLANWKKLKAGKKGKDVQGIPEAPAGDKTAAGEKGRPLAGWFASLDHFEMKDFKVYLTQLTTNPSVEFTLDPFALSLAGLSTDPSTKVGFELQARVNEGGEITAKGKAEPWSRKADGHIQVKGFSLQPLQPYLDRFVRMKLESGRLNTSGDFSYDSGKTKNPFTYEGEGEIASLRARSGEGNQPSWGWDSLSCPKIRLSLAPVSLELGDVDFVKPSGRLIIYEDHTVNFSRILVHKKETQKKERPSGGFRFSAERVHVEQGSLDFADLSLRPNFAAHIHGLNGTIAGISSVPETQAKIELEGRVEKYGMARINGETELFSPTGTTDVTMDFRNIDMTDLTPFSIHFAGYRIASGKLRLGLHYTIQDAKMVGRNHIVAEQFTLGERVESPTALDLPFKLAIGLLKNSKGVIDVGLSVSGDLKNPHFEFGEVVRKALANLLTKIVTAPFSWLASLVGSKKENLDTVPFDPGEATVLPPEKEKLTDLAEGLEKRPELGLQIHGGYDPEVDIPALRSILLQKELVSLEKESLKPGESPGPIVFHDPATQKALESLFLQNHSQETLSNLRADYRKGLSSGKGAQSKEGKAATWAGFYKDLSRRIKEKMEISESRLKALADKRAEAVDYFLVNEKKVDPGRIKVLDPVRVKGTAGNGVSSKLALDVKG